jgi:hypothetical protein
VTAPPAATRRQPSNPAAPYRVSFPAGNRATIGDAVYRFRSVHVERRNPGELELRLTVEMTNNGNYDANFWDRTFRLVVGGRSRAPISGLDDLAPGHSSVDGTVVFAVPDSARSMTLVVGDVPSSAVKVPVALQPT